MEKNSGKAKEIIIRILLFPVALLFLVVVLFVTPFDYLKYKNSRYYKDTKEKYSWFCASSYYIKFYNLIKKENLPINYYRHSSSTFTGYGYFIYNDTLILLYYDLYYDQEKNMWLVEIEDEYIDIKIDIENNIAECNELLGDGFCKKALVLIDKDVFEDYSGAQYENIDFLPVTEGSEAKALLNFIYNR